MSDIQPSADKFATIYAIAAKIATEYRPEPPANASKPYESAKAEAKLINELVRIIYVASK